MNEFKFCWFNHKCKVALTFHRKRPCLHCKRQSTSMVRFYWILFIIVVGKKYQTRWKTALIELFILEWSSLNNYKNALNSAWHFFIDVFFSETCTSVLQTLTLRWLGKLAITATSAQVLCPWLTKNLTHEPVRSLELFNSFFF